MLVSMNSIKATWQHICEGEDEVMTAVCEQFRMFVVNKYTVSNFLVTNWTLTSSLIRTVHVQQRWQKKQDALTFIHI